MKYATFLIILLLLSCTRKRSDEDTSVLKEHIVQLETQLADCRNQDSLLLNSIVAAYNEGNLDSVKVLYEELQELYPNLHDLRTVMDMHYEVIKEETASIREINEKDAANKRSIQKLKTDRTNNNTVYSNALFTHFDNRNLMSLYILKSGNKPPVLMMKLSYKGSDWIHFKKAYLSYGSKLVEIPFDPFEHKETKKDAGVYEWIDVPLKDNFTSFLQAFANAADAKMTLSGRDKKTRTLTPKERSAIIDVLNGYAALK